MKDTSSVDRLEAAQELVSVLLQLCGAELLVERELLQVIEEVAVHELRDAQRSGRRERTSKTM